MSHDLAPDLLRSVVDRILRLKAEQDERAEAIRDIYAEAKGQGLDKTALGRLVTHLRKAEKGGERETEVEAFFALYLNVYENGVSHTHTREAA